MYIYIYTYIYLYLYICIYVYIYIYISVYVYIHKYVFIYSVICIYIYIQIHIFISIYEGRYSSANIAVTNSIFKFHELYLLTLTNSLQMGAAVSSGAMEEGTLVQTLKCHACGCNWRQPASEEEELPKCPQWYYRVHTHTHTHTRE